MTTLQTKASDRSQQIFEMEINDKENNEKAKGSTKEGDIIAKKVIKVIEKVKNVKNSLSDLQNSLMNRQDSIIEKLKLGFAEDVQEIVKSRTKKT